METDADLRKYIRANIKRKLREIGPCVDEELTDYIMVLVANKKNAHQMAEDLSLFLGGNSAKFTLWLHGVLEKLNSRAVEPGLLSPRYLWADSIVSIGNGQGLGQANSRGVELPALGLSKECSNYTDTQVLIKPTLQHCRDDVTEKSLHHVLHAVELPVGHLCSDAGSRVKPELGWPSQGTGHQGSPSPVPDGTRVFRSLDTPWGTDHPLYSYRRQQDSCPARGKVTSASKDRGTREEEMSWRQQHQTLSSEEHLRSNTVSEVEGPNSARSFIPRAALVGGSGRSKLATLEEEVLVTTSRIVQARLDERESPSRSPRFIVTLEGVPSPLRDLEDDGGEKESESVAVKRRKVAERCRFWPACESEDECPYHHPVTKCKSFPHCGFGDKCLFVHPNCKFDAQCTKADCPYTHSSKRSLTSLSRLEAKAPPDLCHFFPECKKMDCQFYHPKPCRFTTRCKRADCYFYHPPVPSGRPQVRQVPKPLNG